MGRIIAISGGDLESTKAINEYAVKMLTTATKNVLFIGTASRDAEGYIDNIMKAFGQWNCQVKALCLTSKTYTKKEITKLISWADIIYVGGGDTIFMMNTWKKYGLDRLLKKVYENDTAILMGISAGAICWFNCGCTDSELAVIKDGQAYGLANDMLNIHNYALCPHYEERVESFPELLKEKQIDGLAMESDTAFVEQNGNIHYIKCNELANAYMLYYSDGRLKKENIKLEFIG